MPDVLEVLMRMKFLAAMAVTAVSLMSTAAFAQFAGVAAGDKKVQLNDKIRPNQIEWVSDAPMEQIKGSAPMVTGQLTIDPAKLESMTGKISFPVKEMKTGNATRDRHLAGKDWLDAESFPNVSFEIAKVKVAGVDGDKARLSAEGTMELHGVKVRMTIPVTLTWKASSAQTAHVPGDWVKIDTKFSIKLGDFKIAGKSGVVGSKVGETIAITGTLYGHTVQ